MRPSSSTPATKPDAFEEMRESLGHLATCLETPLVPGELENWITNARQAADQVGQLLRQQMTTVHKDDFAEISAADPALGHRVEQLQGEDAKSLEQFDLLSQRLDQLGEKVRRVEPNELAIADEMQKVVDQGLAFVIHVQKQEVARRTWLQEAFNRDRGVVD